MSETGLLNMFIVKLGRRLEKAAEELQVEYDACTQPEQFQRIQLLRKLFLVELPSNMSEIMQDVMQTEDEVDFWKFVNAKVVLPEEPKPLTFWQKVRRFI
jgi:hypothetical protein